MSAHPPAAAPLLACRISCYQPFEAGAFAHVASLGLRHVELMCPPAERVAGVAAELSRHGLHASSLHAACDLSRPDVAAQVESQLPVFEALGTPIMFISARIGETPAAVAYQRLREAGQAAGRRGVTIAVETHPELATNGDVALQTMRAVDHPNVRINFDTANVYFYNRGVDAVAELRKLAPFVAAVHLKDTDGGFRHWHFPALGQGIVRFPEVFELLDGVGFRGPYTLEIEGLEGEQRTEELVRQRVADSVEYLRRIGRGPAASEL
jgi:L-ribulose-5-phosphate 3-epimerase